MLNTLPYYVLMALLCEVFHSLSIIYIIYKKLQTIYLMLYKRQIKKLQKSKV